MGKKTLWCPGHKPPPKLPLLGWRIANHLWHPGRRSGLGPQEQVSSLLDSRLMEDGTVDPSEIAAQALEENTRARAVAEAKRFAAWLQQMAKTKFRMVTKPTGAAMVTRYVQSRVVASRRLSPRLQVTSPSTPKTWIRLLAIAYPGKISDRQRDVAALLKGYHALAPALRPLERDVEGRWERALGVTWTRFRAAKTATERRCLFALWLVIRMQRDGLRPKAALRAPLPQTSRSRKKIGSESFYEIAVLLDKDNPVGQQPAPRKRLIPWSVDVEAGMSLLPYPNGKAAVKALVDHRRRLLAEHNIRDTRSARRDALTAAEAQGLDPGAVGNHRPGSASTPRYIMSATPTAIQLALSRK